MEKDDELFKTSNVIRSYFEEDEKQLDSVLTELSGMQDKLKNLIDMFINNPGMRGTQKVLSDQIANFISLQTQKQSVLKDKRSIKENSLNIALKTQQNADNGEEKDQILNNILSMIKNQKKEQNKEKINNLNDNLDEEIEKRLGNNK